MNTEINLILNADEEALKILQKAKDVANATKEKTQQEAKNILELAYKQAEQKRLMLLQETEQAIAAKVEEFKQKKIKDIETFKANAEAQKPFLLNFIKQNILSHEN